MFLVRRRCYPALLPSRHPQGEAIAVNLREMFGLRVPIISVVIGEGGSGGALAIGEQCQWAGVLAGCWLECRACRRCWFSATAGRV